MKRLTLLLLLATGFSACQPKKDSVRANINPQNISSQGILAIPNCSQGESTMGAIYDNASSGAGTFEARVKAFLTATMLPENVGTIGTGSNEGVRFEGTMFLDASGNVVSNRSTITIKVYDSIWAMNPNVEAPIPIEFDPTKGSVLSGQFSTTTGQGYLLLKDQYGEIRFDGTYNYKSFSGTVSYKNYVNVTGAAASSGPLGQFMINSCGIIRK